MERVFRSLLILLFNPERTFPGPHSTVVVTPRAANVLTHSTQRTALKICSIISALIFSGSRSDSAVTLGTTGIRGAEKDVRWICAARFSAAGWLSEACNGA